MIGNRDTSHLVVPKWLAYAIAAGMVFVLMMDAFSAILWTPTQVRSLLEWKSTFEAEKAIEDLNRATELIEVRSLVSELERELERQDRRMEAAEVSLGLRARKTMEVPP